MGKVGVWLHKVDKPLSDTKFGKFTRNLFKININSLNYQKINRFIPQVTINPETGKTFIKKAEILAFKVEGKALSKLAGRAFLRIPVISIFALALLELPDVIKRINNADNMQNKVKEGSIQVLKSSINVTSILAGIGLVGALFGKKGPIFSLVGMGTGSIIGAYFSKELQYKIDKFSIK
jgi:hypothetical protein